MTKTSFVLALLLLLPNSTFAQQSVVEKYRRNYPTPLGAENTIKLLRQIAKEVGGGVLTKTSGNNCLGYSCDIICFSDGSHFDVLGDSDNLAIPQWELVGNIDPSRCEVQVEVVDDFLPPKLDTTPEPEYQDEIEAIVQWLEIISKQLAILVEDQRQQTRDLKTAVEELKKQIQAGIKIRF